MVMSMLITLSGWSQSLLLIDMGVMLLIFAMCQVVSSWCAVPLVRSLVGMFLTLFCVVYLETSTVLMPAAGELIFDAKQTAYRTRCRARNVEHWGKFVLARVEAQRVYGTAGESHNERTWNTLNHSTCSHKWWETLKGSIFGVRPSIPARMEPGGGLVVAPAANASLLGSQFDSKLCREQFVPTLSCFLQSRCNSLAFRTSVLRVCFSILICIGVLILSVGFPHF